MTLHGCHQMVAVLRREIVCPLVAECLVGHPQGDVHRVVDQPGHDGIAAAKDPEGVLILASLGLGKQRGELLRQFAQATQIGERRQHEALQDRKVPRDTDAYTLQA